MLILCEQIMFAYSTLKLGVCFHIISQYFLTPYFTFLGFNLWPWLVFVSAACLFLVYLVSTFKMVKTYWLILVSLWSSVTLSFLNLDICISNSWLLGLYYSCWMGFNLIRAIFLAMFVIVISIISELNYLPWAVYITLSAPFHRLVYYLKLLWSKSPWWLSTLYYLQSGDLWFPAVVLSEGLSAWQPALGAQCVIFVLRSPGQLASIKADFA